MRPSPHCSLPPASATLPRLWGLVKIHVLPQTLGLLPRCREESHGSFTVLLVPVVCSSQQRRAPEGWQEVGALGQWAQPLPGLRPQPSAEAPAGCQNTPPPHDSPQAQRRRTQTGEGPETQTLFIQDINYGHFRGQVTHEEGAQRSHTLSDSLTRRGLVHLNCSDRQFPPTGAAAGQKLIPPPGTQDRGTPTGHWRPAALVLPPSG